MGHEPCKCGSNKWKTKKKGVAWKCRACGMIRTAGLDEMMKEKEYEDLLRFNGVTP